MQSKATTVVQYLAELPEDRRPAIQAVRKVILQNLDKDYEEGMQYGMIGYYVPHGVYPPGCDGNPKEPLPFVNLASQKNYMSLYGMCLYGDGENLAWFKKAWAATGKKLDMGKCCVRFKRLDDLALDVVGESVRRMPVKKYIEYYESIIKSRHSKPAGKKASARLSKISRRRRV